MGWERSGLFIPSYSYSPNQAPRRRFSYRSGILSFLALQDSNAIRPLGSSPSPPPGLASVCTGQTVELAGFWGGSAVVVENLQVPGFSPWDSDFSSVMEEAVFLSLLEAQALFYTPIPF